MELETFPFDAAEYMTEPQDVFYYIEAELEENEPAYWPETVSLVAKARGGFEQLALESGVSNVVLEEAADGSSPTDRGVLLKIMEAFRPESASDRAPDKAIHAV